MRSEKTKNPHNVPLRPELVELLREHLATKHASALAFDVPERTARMLAEDLDDANLPHETDEGMPLKFHSFRVTCATFLGDNGRDSRGIASVTGHLNRAMVDHSTHATVQTARDAQARLPKLA